MKLGEAGEAFFVFETEHEVPEEFQTSPLVEAVQETKGDEVRVIYIDAAAAMFKRIKSCP